MAMAGEPLREILGHRFATILMKRVVLTIAGAIDAPGSGIEIQRISREQTRRSLFGILKTNVLCSMATVTAEGRAHINTAYFSFTRDLVLYFLSHPSSTHCRNLATNPSMAIAVFSSRQIWSGPDRGIQLFGVGHQADGTHAKRAAESYGERFRQFPKWKSKLTPDDPAREYQWYEFAPNYIKIFDEEAFGEAVFVRVDVERYTG
jgi:uncharacterized protein YhbP (UPF0306 family)